MRFVSQYPNWKLQIRPQRSKALGDGGVEVTQEAIYAQFMSVQDGAMIFENEVATALKHFSFRGNTQLQDEATPSDPINRLSVFDSQEAAAANEWSPDTQAEVERALVDYAYNAVQDLFVVTTKPIEAPFPNYDVYDGTPQELLSKLVEDGYDLELVLYYEQTFGMKRAEIIEILQRAVAIQVEQFVTA